MNYDELNEYIKHYIEKDKTQSAIMLTGGWGTGKSYYIHNYLEPFLKENDHRCATVSLYGLKSLSEISKNIYFELRSIGFSKKSEAKTTGGVAAMIVGKTILNGLTSKIGFDIGSISDEDLEKVYSSINLSGVLVILEDLERSNINIIDVLGYINSLVEQDGVKVLLVANEDEILKYYDSQPDKDGKTYKIPDEKTIMYLKAKEKTVNDTIVFNSDYKNAIKKIISSFENETLNYFKSDDNMNEIFIIMRQYNYNLRSFIFACQKTVDIYEKIGSLDKIEEYFIKSIFYGIIAFSMRIKCENSPIWDDSGSFLSTELGTMNYPLYNFCYDYIRWKRLNADEAREILSKHKRLMLFNQMRIGNDKDLSVIFSYHIHYESDVMVALGNVENRLRDFEDIPFYSYEKLAYCLIGCNTALGFDYSLCKERMLQNIRTFLSQNYEVDSKLFIWTTWLLNFDNDYERKQYTAFQNAINELLNSTSSSNPLDNFSYNPKDIDSLYNYVLKNIEKVKSEHKFISRFDKNELVDMIFKCSPYQLNDFRSIFFAVYRDSGNAEFLSSDIETMREISLTIESALDVLSSEMDKILLLQIRYLISNLTDFIKAFV